MILLHPSSLGQIMTNPPMPAVPKVRKSTRKPKTPEDQAALEAENKAIDDDFNKRLAEAAADNDKQLSVGAKTHCKQLAKEFVYTYRLEVSTKGMDKGNQCEQEAIDLYNEVFFTSHTKNTERRSNEWLTGECDIDGKNKIIDIKTAWSLQTFPVFREDAHDTGHEWQGRGYMMLWDKDLFEVAYCLVNTPSGLIGWEQEDIHYIDRIEPALRVTTIQYERDKAKEELIKVKVEAARKYIEECINTIADDHSM